MLKELQSNAGVLKDALEILKVYEHPMRQKILRLIIKNQQLNVSAIYKEMRATQSDTSQHLGKLRKVNLVRAEKRGVQVFYSINYDRINAIQGIIEAFLK